MVQTVIARVYLDTSVISYYAENRATEQAQLWRRFSRQLLDVEAHRFGFWISDLVVVSPLDLLELDA